ncbi:MAG: CoA-binding protein [Promethearchaeota archaeon]
MPHIFFTPKTIAVIGATANPKKFGNAVTINILKNKELKSKLFLVTQNSKEILGIPCFQSILDISEEIELAIILVPAKVVNVVIDECITKKVKRIIIVTAGFGEINDEGKQAENLIGNSE